MRHNLKKIREARSSRGARHRLSWALAGIRNAEAPSAGFCNAEGVFAGFCNAEVRKALGVVNPSGPALGVANPSGQKESSAWVLSTGFGTARVLQGLAGRVPPE